MSKKEERIHKAYNLGEKLQQALSRQPEEEAAQQEEPKPEMEITPAVTLEEMETLQKELEEARRKAEETFDGWQRERADFMNYKKRIERDQEQTRQNATASVLKKYLVILDDLERALKSRPAQGEDAAWADGIELICRKLQNSIESEGVTRIPAEKEQFDPTRHEAITHEDHADHASGEIIEVVQQGYMLGERVLRPALVRVAR